MHSGRSGVPRSSPALSLFGGAAGIVGAVLMVGRSLATLFPVWSHDGGSRGSETVDLWLFGAGGLLQTAGSLLCVLSVVAVLRLAGTVGRFAGVVALLGGFLLLGLVLDESRTLDATLAEGGAVRGDAVAFSGVGVLSSDHRLLVLYLGPLLFGGLAFSARRAVGAVLAGASLVLAVAFALDGLFSGADPNAAVPGAVSTAAEGLWFLAAGIRVFVRTRVSVVPAMP